MTFPTRARSLATAAALLGLATLTGCGTDVKNAPDASDTVSASPAPTPTPTPTASATETPTSSSSPTPTTPGTPLLTAAELPGFNEVYRWRTGSDSANGDTIGACAKFGLTSVGAESVQQRTFLPPKAADTTHDVATQQVARFPDDMTATRAMAVIDSWRADCATRLPGTGTKRVSAWVAVPVATGQAKAYLAQWPATGDEGYFEEFGVVRNGHRITLIQLRHVGQDHNYETGNEPIAKALALAATRLG